MHKFEAHRHSSTGRKISQLTESQPVSSEIQLRRALQDPSAHTLTPQVVYRLQQTYGNRVVQRLIQQARSTEPQSETAGVVQRRVGLEFETTVPYRRPNGPKETAYKTPIYAAAGNAPLGWYAHGDDGNLEFVTTPHSDETALQNTTEGLRDFATNLTPRTVGQRFALNQTNQINGNVAVTGGALFTLGDASTSSGDMKAKVQVTAGIPLDRIIALMQGMPNQRLRSYEDQSSGTVNLNANKPWATYVTGATNWVNNQPNLNNANRDKLKGLLALIISYLDQGAQVPSQPPYAKAYFAVLARTDFYNMYRNMSNDEKQLFTTPNVLAAANMPGTQATRVMGQGFQQQGFPNGLTGPTRGMWLDSIPTGQMDNVYRTFQNAHQGRGVKDAMSTGQVAANSESMGAFNMDTNEALNPKAILEIRELPEKALPPSQWPRIANELFLFIQGLGNTDLT